MSEWTTDRQSELVGRIISGDRAAEDELVECFSSKVLAMLIARTRDREASRDLLNEVLLAVVQSLRAGQLRESAKLAPFIHGVARNAVSGHLRRRGREKREDPVLPETARVFPIDLVTSERESLVLDGLEQLDPTDREILQMTLLEGQKPAQIAAALGMSSELVRQRKSRAVKKLTSYVESLSRIPLRSDIA